MFAFFDQIGTLLGSIVDFITSLFTNSIYFFNMISKSVSFVLQLAYLLPTPIVVAFCCMIAVSLVYLVVGR